MTQTCLGPAEYSTSWMFLLLLWNHRTMPFLGCRGRIFGWQLYCASYLEGILGTRGLHAHRRRRKRMPAWSLGPGARLIWSQVSSGPGRWKSCLHYNYEKFHYGCWQRMPGRSPELCWIFSMAEPWARSDPEVRFRGTQWLEPLYPEYSWSHHPWLREWFLPVCDSPHFTLLVVLPKVSCRACG